MYNDGSEQLLYYNYGTLRLLLNHLIDIREDYEINWSKILINKYIFVIQFTVIYSGFVKVLIL